MPIQLKKILLMDRGIVSAFVFSFGNILVNLVSYPFFLRYLGAENYGLWATLGIVVTLSALGGLGLDNALTKFIAEEYEHRRFGAIAEYFSATLILCAIVGALIFGGVMALQSFLFQILNIQGEYLSIAHSLLPWVVLLSIIIYASETLGGILRGLSRTDLANYYFLFSKILFIVVAFRLLIKDCGIWALLWSQMVSNLAYGLLSYYQSCRITHSWLFSPKLPGVQYFKRLIGFGGTMTLSKFISMLLVPFNKAMIAGTVGLGEVAYFEIVIRMVAQIRNVFNFALMSIIPDISRAAAAHDYPMIRATLAKGYRLILFLGIPSFMLLILCSPYILKIWLADSCTREIIFSFQIILGGYLVNLFSIPVYYTLMGMGKVKLCFLSSLLQSLFNGIIVVVGLFFYSGYNLYVFSYAAAITLAAAVLIIIFRQQYGGLLYVKNSAL